MHVIMAIKRVSVHVLFLTGMIFQVVGCSDAIMNGPGLRQEVEREMETILQCMYGLSSIRVEGLEYKTII